jgi:hypothetical protein
MNLKTFLQNNNVTHFDIIPNLLIVSVIVDGIMTYGLDVDTSQIEAGIELVRVSEYSINNDILSVGALSIDTRTTDLLGS